MDKLKQISLKLSAPSERIQADFQKIGAHVMTPPSAFKYAVCSIKQSTCTT